MLNKKSSALLLGLSLVVLFSVVSFSGNSKYDLVENKEAIKIKKELSAFEDERAKKELSEWL